MPQPSITKICLKITYLKFHSNFPGAKKLSPIQGTKGFTQKDVIHRLLALPSTESQHSRRLSHADWHIRLTVGGHSCDGLDDTRIQALKQAQGKSQNNYYISYVEFQATFFT